MERRKISKEDKEFLLSIKPDDLTFTKLVSIFGDTTTVTDGIKNMNKSRFETTDEMTLSPNEYFVKSETITTAGRFIYNKYIIERCGFQDIVGYVNEPITETVNKKIESLISAALVEDKITMDQFIKYLDFRDTLGYQLNAVITTSFTPKTIKTLPEVDKKKKELFAKYDKEIKDGDIVTNERIEKELLDTAKQILKDDPGMDLYNSESRANMGNYKNMNIFKGATFNQQTKKFDIIKSSFSDGILKDDIAPFGTAVVAGSYPKAVGKIMCCRRKTLLIAGNSC